MKLKFITLTAFGFLYLGGLTLAQDQEEMSGNQGAVHRHFSLERMTERLDLTADQKAKVQPIIDQARPQIEQIRREAMQKLKAVMDNVRSQIRPLLTAEQQKRMDDATGQRHGRLQGDDAEGGQ